MNQNRFDKYKICWFIRKKNGADIDFQNNFQNNRVKKKFEEQNDEKNKNNGRNVLEENEKNRYEADDDDAKDGFLPSIHFFIIICQNPKYAQNNDDIWVSFKDDLFSQIVKNKPKKILIIMIEESEENIMMFKMALNMKADPKISSNLVVKDIWYFHEKTFFENGIYLEKNNIPRDIEK